MNQVRRERNRRQRPPVDRQRLDRPRPARFVLAAGYAVLASLGGCAVDQAEEIARYRRFIDAPDGQGAAPLEAGQPLPLRRALDLANTNNERLGLRGEEYLQAVYEKDRALSAFQPTFSLAPSYSAQGPGRATSHRRSVQVGAQQNLFNGFRDVFAVYRARSTVEQRRQLLLDAQSQLLIDVATAYYNVLRAEQSVMVLEQSLALQQERVRDARTRERIGQKVSLDVLESEAQAAQTQVSLTRAQSDAVNTRNLLAFLVGAPVEPCPLPDQYEPPPTPELPALLAGARSGRQDLAAAASASEAARLGVQTAVGQYYPSLSVNLNYFLSRPRGSVTDWSAAFQATVPIFTGGEIQANVKTAWSQFRQASLNESLLARQIEQDTRVAYQNLISIEKQIEELRIQLDAADKSVQLSVKLKDVGSATNLDVLTALDVQLSAGLQLTGAVFDRKVASLNLLRVTGRLPNPAAVPVNAPGPTSNLATTRATTQQ